MLLTEIATTQPHFLNDPGFLRASFYVHDRFSSVSTTLANEQKFFSSWKYVKHKNANFNLGHVDVQSGQLLIKAVATLDKTLVRDDDRNIGSYTSNLDVNSALPDVERESSNEDMTKLDEKENKRRMRISKANKGNVPWNKGRKHSPETLQLIREKTRLAMQNPKVKMKLAESRKIWSNSEHTRMKIRLGVRIGWEKLRGKQMMREACCSRWQNLIAQAARQGYSDEEELQWDSYEKLYEQLTQEWQERVEMRKVTTKAPGNRKAPKSAEQKKKISEGVAAKWADPGYRERVCSALAEYYATRPQKERKPRRKPSEGTSFTRRQLNELTLSTRRTRSKKKINDKEISEVPLKLLLQTKNLPLYKDPLVSSKLEMIKNIRAQRAAVKSNETEAIERARLLIAEAEKAAKALEVVAANSPVAYASLIEARKLIAEAVRSIKVIEGSQQPFDEIAPAAPASNETTIDESQRVASPAFEVQQQSYLTKINGRSALSDNTQQSSNPHYIGDIPIANGLQPESSNGYPLSVSSGFNNQMDDLGPTRQKQSEAELSTKNAEPQTSVKVEIQSAEEEAETKLPNIKKIWFRGRLVEVTIDA